jgi:polar amino acid transport system ATP-binding protein
MTAPVLQVRDIHVRRGARPILRGVNFEVGEGELVAIKGASGSGKTTILRAIAGLDACDAGGVSVEGVPLNAATLSRVRRKIGMVFQSHCLFEHLTALDNVWLAPVHAYRIRRGEAQERARELLRAFGVEHRAAALPRELSGGEAQRVAIARALAVNPRVLLMDEPTAALDPDRRAELSALLLNLVRQGRTLLVTTHDDEFARAVATRTLRLDAGVLSGT